MDRKTYEGVAPLRAAAAHSGQVKGEALTGGLEESVPVPAPQAGPTPLLAGYHYHPGVAAGAVWNQQRHVSCVFGSRQTGARAHAGHRWCRRCAGFYDGPQACSSPCSAVDL